MTSGSNRVTRGSSAPVQASRVKPPSDVTSLALETIDIQLGPPRARENSDHFVQFYNQDEFLVNSVGRYVVQALTEGGTALLLATPAHLRGVRQHLESAGLAPDELAAAGRYVALDAAGTLNTFMVDGLPDAALFEQHIGSVVERLTAGGRALSAFGEMVALLWAEGRTDAAIRLEELWNLLSQRFSFTLFCAYPMHGFANGGDGRPFLHVCQQHSRILPAEDFPLVSGTTDEQARAVALLQLQASAWQHRADEERAHLAAIVESSDDAIISKTLEGVIRSWNRGAERIFGYSATEAIGQPVTMLMPPERQSEEPGILARLRQGERLDHFETVRRRKDGALLDISLTVSPVRDPQGRIIAASKIARDITTQKAAQRALELARAELVRANLELEERVQQRTASLREAIAQMEEFSYTVSHDLRAPLRGMLVYSQAVLEDHDGSLEPEARHCLVRIAENATRLDKMVTDLLTFSRVSRAELKMERVQLDSLVREIIQQYPRMRPPRVLISVAPLHDVIGHEPSLTQVISNLLGNAVKFVAPTVTPTVRVWTEPQQGGVRLFIQDNGIGVKPEHQPRLFRMFERLHPELPFEGTGVGLAIVRKAANRMGGDVGMISDGVNGSTFWVQLQAPRGAA